MKHTNSFMVILWKYIRFNLKSGMEYRTAFITQIFGMILNNASFIVFWAILYARIDDIKGYGFREIMFLWALAAAGFGLCQILLGNWSHISKIIYQGELDVYLLQPRSVLPGLLISRMVISGWGDIAYGIILYILTQSITFPGIVLFIVFSLLFALLFVSVAVIFHSLTFFLGNAESIAALATEAMISFTLYPGSIFKGVTKGILMTVIPTVWAAYIPVELYREFNVYRFLAVIGIDIVFLIAAITIFRVGLHFYESGNRMNTRL
ncbi:MAG: ABC-2 family transporter protein [Bacteroidetes bacterium]|nr:ABC-2 family transporter protein [Bacteroidota bacterium]